MGKNAKAEKAAQRARGLKKQAKNTKKADKKDRKLEQKLVNEGEGADIDEMLEEFKRQQEEFEKITIEVVERPTTRQGATMVAGPVHSRRELILFGGETVDKSSYTRFFNDTFIYSLNSDTWRKISSPNSPLPRSGHAMASHPSGIAMVFGGEFSSPKQSTFYHYGDTWVLNVTDREWFKVESKKNPVARSGHRLCVWKNYILLFGGFRDLGASTSYLNDLWAFDTKDYQWHQIEIPTTLVLPEPRSGHSLLPCATGAALWGGYSKVKATKGLYKGKVHQDSWILHMKSDLKDVKWERRKKPGFAIQPRIGCYMVPHQGRGVLFGGVYDTKETEESLDSVFYNTLHAFSIEANRWFTLSLRKKKAGASGPIVRQTTAEKDQEDLEKNLEQILANLNMKLEDLEEDEEQPQEVDSAENNEKPAREYPTTTQLPHPRFNASLAVVGDQLFIYGGLWEKGEHEYSFDSMYSVDLGKLDGLTVYWEDLGLDAHANSESEDESDDDLEELEELESESEDEEPEAEAEPLFNNDDDDPRPWLPHPKPFESLHQFYKAHMGSFVDWALKQEPDSRGKDLRKTAFELAESRFWERREAVRDTEAQFDELGAVGDVVERTTARSSRR